MVSILFEVWRIYGKISRNTQVVIQKVLFLGCTRDWKACDTHEITSTRSHDVELNNKSSHVY